MAHSEFLGWSPFRHEDVTTVLSDPETVSNASRHLAIPNGMDPPVHVRCREAIAAHSGQEQMETLEPRTRETAVKLLEPRLSTGQMEFIDGFATPFVLQTLCAWLGPGQSVLRARQGEPEPAPRGPGRRGRRH